MSAEVIANVTEWIATCGSCGWRSYSYLSEGRAREVADEHNRACHPPKQTCPAILGIDSLHGYRYNHYCDDDAGHAGKHHTPDFGYWEVRP